MMGITFLALLLTQVDKVLLSRLLPLESFGYYTLAATAAAVILRIIGPTVHAIYPRMVELSTQEDQRGLVAVYHQGAQLVTVLTAPVVILLSFFAGGVVFMWSGDVRLAENTAPILSALVIGTFLNGLMWMPYQCQLAHAWTSLAVKTNLVAVALLIPAIFWLVPQYGAVGAAWIWVALNAGYVLISIQFMHRRLIPNEKWRWYFADVLLPVAGATGVMVLAKVFEPASFRSRLYWLAFLLVTAALALATSTLLADRIRPRLLTVMGRALHWQYS
jgi:O-antigen/teichoic acid export membrane protein